MPGLESRLGMAEVCASQNRVTKISTPDVCIAKISTSQVLTAKGVALEIFARAVKQHSG